MKKLISFISFLLCISLVLVGCSQNPSQDYPIDQSPEPDPSSDYSDNDANEPQPLSSKNLMEGITPQNIATDIFSLEQGKLTDFAVRLFKASNSEDENTLISPLSVIYALAMTANGAKAETLSQMESAFGVSLEELNEYLYYYQKYLPRGDKYKLNIANSIWFTDDERFTVNRDFLQTNADYYGADIYASPFNDITLNDINNWVNQKTDGMIPKILDEIPEAAVMYLVNALAFEAEWASVYDNTQIRNGTFTKTDGTTQTVEFMCSMEDKYLETDSAKGFIKYFKDRKYAFAALLPNENITLSDYVKSLNGEEIKNLLSNPQSATVDAAIPKFQTEYDILMNDVLKDMGITDAFDGGKADFTGLGTSTDGNIFISRVLHKTFIQVGPKGAKAGAATVVEMEAEGCPFYEDVKEVHLDRPFLYMLIDCQTNTPFFIGTVNSIQ